MDVEHYQRVKRLGKGSFGEVYLVRDSRDGSLWVLKEVDVAQFGPKGRREALKEVGFLQRMQHPFIIGYREFFEQEPVNGVSVATVAG